MKKFSMYLEKNPKPTISFSHRAAAGKTKLLVKNCLLFSEDQQALETEVFQYDSFLFGWVFWFWGFFVVVIGSYFL